MCGFAWTWASMDIAWLCSTHGAPFHLRPMVSHGNTMGLYGNPMVSHGAQGHTHGVPWKIYGVWWKALGVPWKTQGTPWSIFVREEPQRMVIYGCIRTQSLGHLYQHQLGADFMGLSGSPWPRFPSSKSYSWILYYIQSTFMADGWNMESLMFLLNHHQCFCIANKGGSNYICITTPYHKTAAVALSLPW